MEKLCYSVSIWIYFKKKVYEWKTKNKLTNLKLIPIRCFVLRNIKNNSYYVFCFEKESSCSKNAIFDDRSKKPKKLKSNYFFFNVRKLKKKRFF